MRFPSSLFATLSGRRPDPPTHPPNNSRGVTLSTRGEHGNVRSGSISGLSFSKSQRPSLPPRPAQPGYDPPKRTSTPAKILSKLSRPSEDDLVGLQNAAREAGIIAFYRKQLLRAHAELCDAWALFDAAPDSGYNTRQVRAARQALSHALNDYYAATGMRATSSISHILRAAEETDIRIAALDHEITAEVARFEALARDAAADASAADADDALVELEAYRQTIADALDEHTLGRLDTAHATLASIVEASGSMPIARPPSPPPDEFAFVPSAPEPLESPPLPPPSQQNLTELVEAAKLYKNEMERNRMSSIVTSTTASASGGGGGTSSSDDSKRTMLSPEAAAEAELFEAELELRTHNLAVLKERTEDITTAANGSSANVSRRSSAAISLRSKRGGGSSSGMNSTQSPMDVEMETRSLAMLRQQSEEIMSKGGSHTSTGFNLRSSLLSSTSGTEQASSGMIGKTRSAKHHAPPLTPSRKNSPPLRSGSIKSHSLRVPQLRTPSLNLRKRLLSNPPPAEDDLPPIRDSTVDQEMKPASSSGGPRRSKSVMKMRSGRAAATTNGASARNHNAKTTTPKEDVPKRRRGSALFNFSKPNTAANASGLAQKIAMQQPPKGYSDDMLTRHISCVLDEDLKNGASPTTEIVANEAVDKSPAQAGRKPNMSSSMRSFWGLMRSQPQKATAKKERTNRINRSNSATVPAPLVSDMGYSRPPYRSDTAPPSPPSSPPPPEPQDNDVVMKDKSSDDTGGTSADGSDSTESGEELPKGLVMPRAPTLRDAAEFARQQEEEEGANSYSSFARRTPRRTSAASFSAALYATPTRRAEAVSDVGVLLTCSKVMGDGRCLFRSVVRGRAVAKNEMVPKAHAEKKAADKLRARAVAELRRHRGLLLKFYVIEENFESYIERMALPRTYAGEPELLMLAKVLRMPIAVYLLMGNGMYRRIQLYGKHYQGEPIRIRYVNDTHYDTLMPSTYPYRVK